MTQPTLTPSAKIVATQFFDAYRKQDVSAMVQLFDPAGVVEYVPFNLKGSVEAAGAGTWNTLIDAFPNLTNRVLSIHQDETGHIAHADVFIGGTQTKEVLGVINQNKTYDLRHLFVFKTNAAGKITSLVSFWDNADWYQQLGKTSLI
ncbi:MAG: nuclear transport factor 2 family protein [Phormidesmis sp.]